MLWSGFKGGVRRCCGVLSAFLILLLCTPLLSASRSFSGSVLLTDDTPEGDPTRILFSHTSGTYTFRTLEVTLKAPAGYTVAYTTDSSVPTAEDDCGRNTVTVTLDETTRGELASRSGLMTLPVHEDAAVTDDPTLPFGCVLRAMAVGPNGETGRVRTEVFFPGTDFAETYPGCLVLSVTADPDDLLDYETGILASGAVYDEWVRTEEAQELIREGRYWEYQANFTQHGKAWERPCCFQIYDSGQRPAVSVDAGIRVAGHLARLMGQRSFNVYFRKVYGSRYLDYELFEGTERYSSIQLRSGGNNALSLKFKGAMIHDLSSGREFLTIRSRPAVLFLNGEYWGPYMLSEKISEDMLEDRCGADPDQVVVFKQGKLEEGESGDEKLYRRLMSYADRDMTDPKVWKKFRRIMNVRSFAECFAARIYIGDIDWNPYVNDVLWRTRDDSYDGGRWQYVLYDPESSAGVYYEDDSTSPETDHFRLVRERYPLFDSALRNPEFYALFLASIREIGGSDFAPARVKAVLQGYLDVWTPLMPDYYKRFGDYGDRWGFELDSTVRFFEDRYGYILPYVERYDPKMSD